MMTEKILERRTSLYESPTPRSFSLSLSNPKPNHSFLSISIYNLQNSTFRIFLSLSQIFTFFRFPNLASMDSAAALPSFHSGVGRMAHVGSILEKPFMVPIYNAASRKPLIHIGLSAGGRLFSSLDRNGSLLPSVKCSGASLAMTSNTVASDSSLQGPPEKKHLQSTIFPNGFESLVLEVCDETDVAELKLKIGDFEMHLKRNIGATVAPTPPIASPSTPPPVPSKPMVESVSASPQATSLSKSASTHSSPFSNVSLSKESKLAALEASGASGYVLVLSPTVGSFRRGRTVKGKKQPPICKEGDMIKEGQVIGYLDQFGSELPIKSDAAGEILKLLYKDGEGIGYGDPLVAVLPSFHGIQ